VEELLNIYRCYFCSIELIVDDSLSRLKCESCFNKYHNEVYHHYFDFIKARNSNKLNSITITYKYNNLKYYIVLLLEENKTRITKAGTLLKAKDIIFPGFPITPQNIKEKFPLYLTLG